MSLGTSEWHKLSGNDSGRHGEVACSEPDGLWAEGRKLAASCPHDSPTRRPKIRQQRETSLSLSTDVTAATSWHVGLWTLDATKARKR